MKKTDLTLKSIKKIFLENMEIPALFLFGFSLVFIGLSGHSFTLDETFSLFISKNWSEMTKILWNEEANMWLYYLILHFWQKLGTNEFVIRSLSLIFAVGSTPLAYGIGKKLFNEITARMSVLLLVLNFFYIIAAQFARGYSLLLLLTLASTYSFLRFNENKKYKVLYILSSVLSVYTHFYAGFVILSQVLTAILTKKFKSFFYAFLSVGIFLIPILFSPSILSNQVDWITRPTTTNLLGTAYVLSGDFPPLFIIYGLLFIFITPFVVRNLREFKYQFLSSWLLAPIVLAFLFSLFVKPLYQSVYFLISLPPFVLLAADGMGRLSRKKLKSLFLIAIMVLSIFRLSLWYSRNTDYKWVFSNNDEDWRLATSYINDNARDNDAIVFYGYYNRVPYEYYSQKDTPKIIEIADEPYSLGGGSELPEPNYELLTNLDFERLWLLLREGDRGILDRDEQLAKIQAEIDKKYSEEFVRDFPGLKLILYSIES